MSEFRAQAIVADLLGKYLTTLDTGKLDAEWARRLFTNDIVIEFPMSRHEGINGIDLYHTDALSKFAATQHLSSLPVVGRTGPGAIGFEAQVLSVHVHHRTSPDDTRPERFSAGTAATGAARLTTAGWRLRRLSFRVVWTDGSPQRPAA
jgi:hypothetical protein